MFDKTMMLVASSSDFYPYYTVKMEKVPTDNPMATVNIESEIKPNGIFQLITYAHTKNSYIEFDITTIMAKRNIGVDEIKVTRLDTGQSLNLFASGLGFQSFSGILFNLSDVGKPIQITIELLGGGLAGFFMRFVTFLRGGLRNAKKNDANEQHYIANWSRGIRHYSCLCNWNHQRNRVSKIIWSEWKFGSYRIPRAYDPISWLWQRRNENTRNTNHVWKCSVNLCENLYTKDRYPNNIKTRICTGRHSCLVKSDRFIFKGRCRQGNSFINPNRIASSALCAGGCHA